MPKLVVVKPHPYESRNREVGTEYEATESDARLLVLSGQARYADGRSQSYQTRDMSAARPRRNRRAAA